MDDTPYKLEMQLSFIATLTVQEYQVDERALSHLLKVSKISVKFKENSVSRNNMFQINPKLQKYFKGFCYSSHIIMVCLYMKFRFSLSYRDIEELCQLRGLTIKWLH